MWRNGAWDSVGFGGSVSCKEVLLYVNPTVNMSQETFP